MGWFNKNNEMLGQNVQTSLYPMPTLRNEDLSFQLFRAVSGYVVQFTSYDTKTDRTEQKLYIINDSDDFDTAIGDIIRMQLLGK